MSQSINESIVDRFDKIGMLSIVLLFLLSYSDYTKERRSKMTRDSSDEKNELNKPTDELASKQTITNVTDKFEWMKNITCLCYKPQNRDP